MAKSDTPGEVVMSKEQLTNTLAAIDILKVYFKGEPAVTGQKIVDVAKKVGTDGLLTGYNNLAAILTKSFADAAKQDNETVIAAIEQMVNKIPVVD